MIDLVWQPQIYPEPSTSATPRPRRSSHQKSRTHEPPTTLYGLFEIAQAAPSSVCPMQPALDFLDHRHSYSLATNSAVDLGRFALPQGVRVETIMLASG